MRWVAAAPMAVIALLLIAIALFALLTALTGRAESPRWVALALGVLFFVLGSTVFVVTAIIVRAGGIKGGVR